MSRVTLAAIGVICLLVFIALKRNPDAYPNTLREIDQLVTDQVNKEKYGPYGNPEKYMEGDQTARE